jgi:hypothetical protein
VLTIYPSDGKQENNKEQILMLMGNPSCPNFVLAQDSISTERLNYIWFGSKDSENVFF